MNLLSDLALSLLHLRWSKSQLKFLLLPPQSSQFFDSSCRNRNMSGSTLLTQHKRTDSRIEKLEKKNKKNTSSTDMLKIYLKFLHVGHLSRRDLDGQTPACFGRAGDLWNIWSDVIFVSIKNLWSSCDTLCIHIYIYIHIIYNYIYEMKSPYWKQSWFRTVAKKKTSQSGLFFDAAKKTGISTEV